MAIEARFGGTKGISDGPILQLRSATISRAVGRPIEWILRAYLSSEAKIEEGSNENAELMIFVRFLTAQPAFVRIFIDDVAVSIAGKVIGAAWADEHRSVVDITVHASYPKQERPSPFWPRRRVIEASNMKLLFDAFEDVAPCKPNVKTKLEAINFPDGDRACVIQDGVSDWDFFHIMLSQYGLLQEDENLRRIMLIGTASEDYDHGWVVDWADGNALEAVGETQIRMVSAKELGQEKDIAYTFGCEPVYQQDHFATGAAATVVERIQYRDFETARFRSWIGGDAPLISKDFQSLVTRIVDHIEPAEASSRNYVWRTELHHAPCGVEHAVIGGLGKAAQRPWIGRAEVTDNDEHGPWIKARLDGFEEGADTASFRLTTPYSGLDGDTGVHYTPEIGTPIFGVWSGRFGETLFFGGNCRDKAAKLPGPSLWLDKTYAQELSNIEVSALGDVKIEPDLRLFLEARSQIKGGAPMQLEVDGTDVKLERSIFYTGIV